VALLDGERCGAMVMAEVAVDAASEAALYSGVVDIILILYCFATHRAVRHNLHADVG